MPKGKVKWFDSSKGYGFIQIENGSDIFVHKNSLEGKSMILVEGQKVSFNVATGAKGPMATNVKIIDKKEISLKENEARAPYNFIPLNEVVVESKGVPEFNVYHHDLNTGYIDLNVITKTPLYIRDTLTLEEMKKKNFINPDFFSPGGNICIPGSSLRGMIRTLVEIMSFGKFENFDDKRLYYRTFGGGLGKVYRKIMTDENDRAFPKVKAGKLKKEGKNYVIYPSKSIQGTQIYRINFNKKDGIINGPDKIKMDKFDFKEVYFQPVSPEIHNEHEWPLKYALLKSLGLKKDNQHPQRGFLVSSGQFSDKKHMHWVINEPDSNAGKIDIDNDLIKSYIDDVNRKVDDKADLINYIKKNPGSEVPCFYIEENGKVKSFGHTGMFRLAYDNTIGYFVKEELKDNNKIDIAEAIFGNETSFAGRVFFEDVLLEKNQTDVFVEESIPQILAGPNPTSFQLYLEQGPKNLKNHSDNLINYNSKSKNNSIRGYKLYWHKTGKESNWKESKISFSTGKFNELLKNKNKKKEDFGKSLSTEEGNPIVKLGSLSPELMQIILEAVGIYETQHTKIIAVKKDKNFSGRIRFENLSYVELGALLFALDLPHECYHKLGMGKPLGLGSVKIKPRLFLSDRKKRYESLFSEWETDIKESKDKGKPINDFKEKFQEYILKKIGEKSKGITDLWSVERIKELKRMLDFSTKPDDKITEYMPLKGDGFKKRKVLLKPSEIKERDKKRRKL